MKIYRALAVTFLQPVSYGKGYSNTNNEHEERLDKIPEMQSMPFVVTQLSSNELRNSSVDLAYLAVKSCAFADEQKHCKSTEKIYRDYPVRCCKILS
jgi:hypothetical protein